MSAIFFLLSHMSNNSLNRRINTNFKYHLLYNYYSDCNIWDTDLTKSLNPICIKCNIMECA